MRLTATQSKCVQVLRGVAIIAVVFIHNTPAGLSQVFCRPFYNFPVGLFLFLSGMLSNAENWCPKKRILKVIIPYIFWSMIYTVMYNISDISSITIEFLKNIIGGDAAEIMYYIFVYCEFTLLIPIIDKLAKSKFKYWGFVITPVEIIIMRLLPLIIGREMNMYISSIMSISCLGWFTYFYLGYLLGNKLITIDIKTKKLTLLWIVSILFQMGEGFLYYNLGYTNCGSQLKLTSIITGVVFALLAYDYVMCGRDSNSKKLYLLGNCSFGIYFSHIAVISIMRQIPAYMQYIPYPIKTIIILVITMICVLIGKKVLGKYSTYLAL